MTEAPQTSKDLTPPPSGILRKSAIKCVHGACNPTDPHEATLLYSSKRLWRRQSFPVCAACGGILLRQQEQEESIELRPLSDDPANSFNKDQIDALSDRIGKLSVLLLVVYVGVAPLGIFFRETLSSKVKETTRAFLESKDGKADLEKVVKSELPSVARTTLQGMWQEDILNGLETVYEESTKMAMAPVGGVNCIRQTEFESSKNLFLRYDDQYEFAVDDRNKIPESTEPITSDAIDSSKAKVLISHYDIEVAANADRVRVVLEDTAEIRSCRDNNCSNRGNCRDEAHRPFRFWWTIAPCGEEERISTTHASVAEITGHVVMVNGSKYKLQQLLPLAKGESIAIPGVPIPKPIGKGTPHTTKLIRVFIVSKWAPEKTKEFNKYHQSRLSDGWLNIGTFQHEFGLTGERRFQFTE